MVSMIDNIPADIAVIGCVLNNRKTVDIFCKPCKLAGILGLGVLTAAARRFSS